MVQSFKDLTIYKEAYDLAICINRSVNTLPRFEQHDLSSQLRRASKSIPANIAEAWGKRRFVKEFQRQLDIALGSCNEMEVHITMAKDLGFWKKNFCNPLLQRYVYLGGKIVNLRDKWKQF